MIDTLPPVADASQICEHKPRTPQAVNSPVRNNRDNEHILDGLRANMSLATHRHCDSMLSFGAGCFLSRAIEA
ncbi:MAG: hypothetical protein ACE5Q3_10905 [Alphaproteobacteria bacterium]